MNNNKKSEATIVIVEDEPEIMNFAARVLELEGYHILQAGDGETGLRLSGEQKVALMLLDLRLPGCDGWSVLVEMKKRPELSAIPVVVFSASADASSRERALSLGAMDYLVKPLGAATLREAIARALNRCKVCLPEKG